MKHTLIALAVLALAGCETSPRASAPADPAPKAADPHEEKAPLQLSLNAVADQDGVLELQAHLDSHSGVSLPIELSIELPPGATLLDGQERQSVPVPAGRTSRNFRIKHDAKLAPVKVVAHVVHPDRAWGIHAEKFYPEKPKSLTFSPSKPPPLARPPIAPTLPAAHAKEAP